MNDETGIEVDTDEPVEYCEFCGGVIIRKAGLAVCESCEKKFTREQRDRSDAES